MTPERVAAVTAATTQRPIADCRRGASRDWRSDMRRETWHRVLAPKAWRPEVDDELIGTYMSSKLRVGQFGEYRVHFVKSRAQIYYVSGAMVNDLFAVVKEGDKVKLVYKGLKQARDTDKEYKLFELYTEEAVEFKLTGDVA